LKCFSALNQLCLCPEIMVANSTWAEHWRPKSGFLSQYHQ
jgi:hypothetical protein